jgi:hypothetical protein
MGDYKVINFAMCWNSLVPISTFNSKNLIGYAQSAGNLSILFYTIFVFVKEQENYKVNTDKSSSETTREMSFNFEAYRKLSKILPEKLSDE